MGRVWAAALAVLTVLALPASYAAFSGKTTTAASFAAASTFPTYPTQVNSASPAYYHREDDNPAYASGSAAADSSSNSRAGTYTTGTDGPVAYWPFDEGTGTTVSDASGGGTPLTMTNGATWGAGHVGTAAGSFDGVDDYAISAGPVVDTSISFSVSAWVYNTGAYTDTRNVVGQAGAAYTSGWYLQANGGKWIFYGYDIDNPFYPSTTARAVANVAVNKWTFLTGVYDDPNDQMRLYVDGQMVATVARTSDWNATGPVTVGTSEFGHNNWADFFKGQIDDVRIYGRALSSGEVTQLANRPRTEWTYDTATAAQPDASGNGNTGTSAGSPTYSGSGIVMSGAQYTTGLTRGVHTDRSFSVAAWASPSSTTGTLTLASLPGTTASSYALASTSGFWTFSMTSADSASPTVTTVTSSTAATSGTLAYVVGVYDQASSQMRLYVNGKLEGTVAISSSWDGGGVLNAGRQRVNGSYTNYFQGRIDDLEVFDEPLLSDDVYALDATPVASYQFDENSPTPIADGSGSGNVLTKQAGTTTWAAAGHRGGALALSSSAYLTTASGAVTTNASYSVAAWVYLTTAGGTNQTILSQSGTNTSAFELQYRAANTSWAFAQQPTDSAAAANTITSAASSAAAGRWVHLVGVYDATGQKAYLYVNGVSAGSVSATASFASSGSLVLGADKVGGSIGRYFTGTLDQVTAYSGVLSAADVTTLYQQDPVLKWNLDENTGTTTADRSGNNTTGTLVNGPTWTTGVSGSAISFDGVDDVVSASSVKPDASASFSVAVWVYLTDDTVPRMAMSQNGSNYYRWAIGFDGSRWVFNVTSANTTSPTVTSSQFLGYSKNTWVHLAGVYNAVTGSVNLYVNTWSIQTQTQTNLWNGTTSLVLGYGTVNGSPAQRWKGYLDEAYVFQRALTQLEINALYGGYALQPGASTMHLPSISSGILGALQGSQQGLQSSTAMAFNGAGAAYNGYQFTNPNAFTEEMYFKVSGSSGGTLAGFTTSTTSMATTADRVLYVNSTGKVTFGVSPGGVNTLLTTTASYNDGSWHHVVASLGSAGMKLYIDGVLKNSNASVTTALTATGYFRWGAINLSGWTARPSSDYLIGSIDEFAIYPSQLSDNTVARHYAANH